MVAPALAGVDDEEGPAAFILYGVDAVSVKWAPAYRASMAARSVQSPWLRSARPPTSRESPQAEIRGERCGGPGYD